MTATAQDRCEVVETLLGTVTLQGPPEPGEPSAPVVLIVGTPQPEFEIDELPARLQGACAVCFAEVPPDPNPTHRAEILSRALHQAFLGRPVVLLGCSDDGLVAALCHAPELLRVVAIDPPIRGEGGEDFGVAYSDRRIPLEIIEGPAAALSAEDRTWLAAASNVVLVAAPAGEPLPAVLAGVLREAAAWASGFRRAPPELARRLAAAMPRTVRRVRFSGPAFADFAAAYAAFNPDAEVSADIASYDALALVAPDPGSPALVAEIAGLEPGGSIVALTSLGAAGQRLEAALAAQGLSLSGADAQLTPLGGRLVRARKASPAPPTQIELVAYADYLMDIRTRLPMNGLRTELGLDVDLHRPPFLQAPASPRVVILQRAPAYAPADWHALAARAIQAGQVLVAEFDDHPDLTSMMRRGRPAADAEWEQFRVAHAVQTSTQELVPVFGALNPEVRAFPNCVFELPPFSQAERSLRVFYGAALRGPFAVEVAKALAPAIEAFPDLEFHVVSDRDVFEALPTTRKRFDELMPYERYLAAMAHCCVSLSPLEARPMAETKSDAKYLDAARAGVLTIASPTLYERVIRHGENGLLAATLADWPALLAQAIGDPQARRRMAKAAWDDVRAHRMFSQQIATRRDWCLDLLARREALNQALLDRSPGVAEVLARLTAER